MLTPAFLLGAVGQPSPSALPLRAQLAPVLDATVEQSAPLVNYGREPSLVLGNGRAVFVDFPELMWARFSGRKVASAKLVFTLSRGSGNIALSVSSLKKKWMEGPGRAYRFDKFDPANPAWGSVTWNFARQGRDGLKWTDGGAKSSADSAPIEGLSAEVVDREVIVSGIGAAIQERIDHPFATTGFRIESKSECAFFSGEWTDERPRLEITWADSAPAGPDLALMAVVPAAEKGSYTAIVKNVGSEAVVSAQLTVAVFGQDHTTVAIPGPIPPGGTKTATFGSSAQGDPADPRKTVLQVILDTAGDVALGNNSLEYYPTGVSVAFESSAAHLAQLKSLSPAGEPLLLYQQTVARVNHFILPFSRFVTLPEGVFQRINVALDPATADFRIDLDAQPSTNTDDLARACARSLVPLGNGFGQPPSDDAPWPKTAGKGFGWLPDTRDDGLRIPGLELPALGFAGDSPVPLWDNGLLSRTEAWFLQSQTGKKPADWVFPWKAIQPGLLIHAVGANGENLVQTQVSLFRPGSSTPLATVDSANGGFAFFTPDSMGGKALFAEIKDGASAWILVRASRNGAVASTWLPAWQLLDWSVRGNGNLPNVELRFNLPSRELDTAQNLAADKVVTDSTGKFPAQLAVLVDDKTSTAFEVGPRQWVEIDLGRDRIVGQVNLVLLGNHFPNLEIWAYGTSQTSDAAIRWVALPNLDSLAEVYGAPFSGGVAIPVVHSAMRMRYVRLINRGEQPVNVSDIMVIPVKAQG